VTYAVTIIDSCILAVKINSRKRKLRRVGYCRNSSFLVEYFRYSTPLHFIRLAGLAVPGMPTLSRESKDGSGFYSQFSIAEAIVFIRGTAFDLLLYK
jgi:hypothetical protein